MTNESERSAHGPSWDRSMTEHEPEPSDGDAAGRGRPHDDAIRALVERLARRHPSGGTVIERAAILAEGADSAAVVAWIIAHDGKPEAAVTAPSRGLHGPRLSDPMGSQPRPPLRYVLPADTPA